MRRGSPNAQALVVIHPATVKLTVPLHMLILRLWGKTVTVRRADVYDEK
jgi:hypothetical protein